MAPPVSCRNGGKSIFYVTYSACRRYNYSAYFCIVYLGNEIKLQHAVRHRYGNGNIVDGSCPDLGNKIKIGKMIGAPCAFTESL